MPLRRLFTVEGRNSCGRGSRDPESANTTEGNHLFASLILILYHTRGIWTGHHFPALKCRPSDRECPSPMPGREVPHASDEHVAALDSRAYSPLGTFNSYVCCSYKLHLYPAPPQHGEGTRWRPTERSTPCFSKAKPCGPGDLRSGPIHCDRSSEQQGGVMHRGVCRVAGLDTPVQPGTKVRRGARGLRRIHSFLHAVPLWTTKHAPCPFQASYSGPRDRPSGTTTV